MHANRREWQQPWHPGRVIIAVTVIGIALVLVSSNETAKRDPGGVALSSERVLSEGDRRKFLAQAQPVSEGITSATAKKMERAVRSKNVTINFWGKLVDRHGAPVEGVRITATPRRWQLRGADIGASFEPVVVYSDAQGCFEITNQLGDVLTMKAIEKEGYEAERLALRSFGYNISTNVVVSKSAPIVFRLWKREDRGQLVSGRKFFSLEPDGRKYTINLLTTNIVESAVAEGDLRIAVTRPLDATLGQRFDWTVEIEALNGGLLEEPDRYAEMLLAPTNGYTNNYRFVRKAADRPWSGVRSIGVYTRTRNTMYSSVKLQVWALYGTGKNIAAVDIKFVCNPSGSEVLR